MTFEQYEEYYERYGFVKGSCYKPKNKYNERQLYRKYEKYMSKRNSKGQTELQELREKALERDKECQLCNKISVRDKAKIDSICDSINVHGLDMAHVFERGSYPKMALNLDNVVMLKRPIHNRLDTNCNPITGERISLEETISWWEYIIGKERYLRLKEETYE